MIYEEREVLSPLPIVSSRKVATKPTTSQTRHANINLEVVRISWRKTGLGMALDDGQVATLPSGCCRATLQIGTNDEMNEILRE